MSEKAKYKLDCRWMRKRTKIGRDIGSSNVDARTVHTCLKRAMRMHGCIDDCPLYEKR